MEDNLDEAQGNGAFTGYWLTRAAELMRRQGDAFLEAQGVSLPSQCVSMMLALQSAGPVSITEIAGRLGISHQLARQRLQAMLALNYVRETGSKSDQRKREIALTVAGRREATRLNETLNLAEHVIASLLEEIGVDLVSVLKAFERALLERSLLDRSEAYSPSRRQTRS